MRKLLLITTLFFSIPIQAQILVHEEPLHHVKLDNQYLRVLQIVAAPGDTSLFHKHPNDYFYLTLKGSTIWNEVAESEGRKVSIPSGFSGGYYSTHEKPMVHRFANIGTDTLVMLAIERKQEAGDRPYASPPLMSNEKLIFENNFFRVTRLWLESESAVAAAWDHAVLVNLLGHDVGASDEKGFSRINTYRYATGSKKITIRNNDSQDIELTIVQVK